MNRKMDIMKIENEQKLLKMIEESNQCKLKFEETIKKLKETHEKSKVDVQAKYTKIINNLREDLEKKNNQNILQQSKSFNVEKNKWIEKEKKMKQQIDEYQQKIKIQEKKDEVTKTFNGMNAQFMALFADLSGDDIIVQQEAETKKFEAKMTAEFAKLPVCEPGNHCHEEEAALIAMIKRGEGKNEESEKQTNEIIDLKEQLEEERMDWKKKRNMKNKRITEMQTQLMQMEDELEDAKMKISELEKQKSVMANCVKKETACYNIHRIVNERTKKCNVEYEVEWSKSWVNEDKIPELILKEWNRKKVKRESSASYKCHNEDEDDDDKEGSIQNKTSILSLNNSNR